MRGPRSVPAGLLRTGCEGDPAAPPGPASRPAALPARSPAAPSLRSVPCARPWDVAPPPRPGSRSLPRRNPRTEHGPPRPAGAAQLPPFRPRGARATPFVGTGGPRAAVPGLFAIATPEASELCPSDGAARTKALGSVSRSGRARSIRAVRWAVRCALLRAGPAGRQCRAATDRAVPCRAAQRRAVPRSAPGPWPLLRPQGTPRGRVLHVVPLPRLCHAPAALLGCRYHALITSPSHPVGSVSRSRRILIVLLSCPRCSPVVPVVALPRFCHAPSRPRRASLSPVASVSCPYRAVPCRSPQEAARTDRRLLDFPSKLPHVGLASRIEEAEVEAELQRLAARVAAARGPDAASGPGLRPFLRAAEEELRAARAERERMCGTAAAALDFYCEEAAPGALRELCAVLHGFAGRFLNAVQENRAREQAQRRRRQLELQRHKRRSVATCSLRDAEPGGSARPLDAAPALLRRNTAPALPELRGDPESPRPERFPSAPAPSGPASPSRFAALFSRWGSRRAPPAPSGGSALLGFLRRLAGGAARGAPPS
ncbi:uncharacterized protein LOC110391883 isoform X1 [Numida meleagris]|uniref:uncharacterized protein LOC110391883 isoform X1 n=1 Tax=Numida meleagris TaxID=8996 RepID=UPI000B3E171D|nr:uncharacterized protein LOC110391883 isoform X1 [Numida meleagris]